MLLRDGAALDATDEKPENDSPERGVATECTDVIVFVRLLPLSGTAGGIARSAALPPMLCSIVAPLNRRVSTGFGCVGVTVRLLHLEARDTLGVLRSPGGLVLTPSMEQMLRHSTIVM